MADASDNGWIKNWEWEKLRKMIESRPLANTCKWLWYNNTSGRLRLIKNILNSCEGMDATCTHMGMELIINKGMWEIEIN